MSHFDKLLQRILTLPKDVRFEELKKILEYYGYEMSNPGTGGSHLTFRKKGCAPITIPKSSPIKVAYVKLVKEVIEREISTDENDR